MMGSYPGSSEPMDQVDLQGGQASSETSDESEEHIPRDVVYHASTPRLLAVTCPNFRCVATTSLFWVLSTFLVRLG